MKKLSAFITSIMSAIGNRVKSSTKRRPTVGGWKKEIYSKVMRPIVGERFSEPGISEFAMVADSAKIAESATIAAGVYIGANVRVGENTRIYPNVTILDNTVIGNKVFLGSGTVIGGEGFGFYLNQKTKDINHFLHIGKVVIEDEVYIGSNVCIDRSSTDATIVGRGTKIGNLVMIGHNVKIGVNCLIMASSSISGSTVIGDSVVVNPQSAISKHVKVGDNVEIGMNSTVIRDVRPNTRVLGSPAKEK